MYYSLTFIADDGVEKNTWDDWHMIPNTPPMISPPEPEINLIEVPGRSRGPIDMTGAAFDKVTYKRMTGTWTFYKEPESTDTRRTFYDYLISYFTGRIIKVILKDEDPIHFYVGRFKISTPATSRGPMTFQISYDLIPARWNVSDNTVDPTYGAEDVSSWVDPTIPPRPYVLVEWDEINEEVEVIFQ